VVSHFIACKNYEEKITTIHTFKSYYDAISRQQESNQQAQKDKRVLVVDDEYDISLTIKVVLEENGFKVDSFTDASEVLKNFTTGLYDLVVLDVKMPAMSGFSLYKKIRKLDDKVIICYLTAVDEVSYEDLKKVLS
jgi:CheY-like chemotaxis protein